jgi:hypothetical protein
MHGTFEPEWQTASNHGETSGEHLGNLLRQVSKTSVGEIDGLLSELQTLRCCDVREDVHERGNFRRHWTSH